MAEDMISQQSATGDEAELRYLVERLLARTSLASEGQDEKLDGLLEELRQYLRGRPRDASHLKDFQARLDDELKRLEDLADSDARQIGRALSRLLESVGSSPVFQRETNQLKRLQTELGYSGLGRKQLLPWLETFADVADRALARRETERQRNGGLFGKLLGRQADAAQQEPDSCLDVAPPVEDASSLPPYENEHAQRLRIARRVGELLDRLLEHVDLPPKSHRRVVMLKARLSEQQDWELLRESLDEAADLVIAVVNHSQQAFEHFLHRLDERLLSLHGHFSQQEQAMAGRQSASAELERSLQEKLTDLGDTLHGSDNLADLRGSVLGHIDLIAATVKTFRQQESEREQQLAGHLAAMQEKLAALETHSETMREQLAQERSRALTDVLTGLPNREAWNERVQFEHERWQRYRHPVTLCMVDIDHFKRVNDSFGHKAGDRVIQIVARALKERLRTTDFVARYGGEEFVVLLPETAVSEARKVIDDLREYVSQMPFHFQGKPIRITFSAGLSWLREGVDPDRVFDEADKALYRAKEAGRNQVASAQVA